MPSFSKAQRKLMGMALAYKRGELKNASDKIKELANSMSEKQLKDFASNVKKEKIQEADPFKTFKKITKIHPITYKQEMNVKASDEKELSIRELIRNIIREMTTTGNIAGFEIPYAFADDEEKKKKRDKQSADAMGYELMESIDWSNKEMSHKEKIAESIKLVKKNLNEIEKLVNKTVKYKTEYSISQESFWKPTKIKLAKISEQMIRISNKIKNGIN